jgi:hypothetical protein
MSVKQSLMTVSSYSKSISTTKFGQKIQGINSQEYGKLQKL